MGVSALLEQIKSVLRDALQLDRRANGFTADTPLLGSLLELESMGVVAVLTLIEEGFDVTFDDSEITAEPFETVGTLAEFVGAKVGT